MTFDILTLFPHMVDDLLNESIIGRARQAGFLHVRCHNIRDYTTNKHRSVDDTPYGGGAGMVMAVQPIYDCFSAVKAMMPPDGKDASTRVVYLSPKGRVLTQEIVQEFSRYDRLILLCGHYEGVDQRAIDLVVDEEISIGDYVLTGGELPACILVDAVSRLLPGVLADRVCYEDESIASGLLEYPQYTRPVSFMDKNVPDVLLSGHHAQIEKWRLEESIALTKERRPDLYEQYVKAHPAPPKKRKATKSPPQPEEK